VTITDANGCKKIVGTYVTTQTTGCDTASRLDEGNTGTAMMVYPNPADRAITVSMPAFEGTASLQIVNALGQIVADERVNNQTATLDVSVLSAGVYNVRFESNGLVETAKFIKQ
jgi:hypothetical protein